MDGTVKHNYFLFLINQSSFCFRCNVSRCHRINLGHTTADILDKCVVFLQMITSSLSIYITGRPNGSPEQRFGGAKRLQSI